MSTKKIQKPIAQHERREWKFKAIFVPILATYLICFWIIAGGGDLISANAAQSALYGDGERGKGMLAGYLTPSEFHHAAWWIFVLLYGAHFVEFVWIFVLSGKYASVQIDDFVLTMLFGLTYWQQLPPRRKKA